jgi:hypothetical protein
MDETDEMGERDKMDETDGKDESTHGEVVAEPRGDLR